MAEPSRVNSGPPLSPLSAHTVVRMSPVTRPSGQLTVAFSEVTRPWCRPVVLPIRSTCWLAFAAAALVMATVRPPPTSTTLGALVAVLL
ncbi:hypothetical protein QRX60_44900 [Amycolatopsis mongoliensis]|uniref:Uncharacterized protein n=1 Tax=Amycolatopsis mongoliensis TaxID=715475 RepID=A0A9Y2JP87_9PSEU|nr:hypothetical protein [Amycolatopsis sp. 4-36]WIY01101.1 hypothetical protein QRX60_44900 [Amycolatopsis sp. 4-36]